MKSIILSIFVLQLTLSSFATIGPITGDSIACIGSLTQVIDTTAGGVWNSSNTTIATVDPFLGYIIGVTAGTVTITYSVSASFVTKTILVYPTPDPITGPSSFCTTGSITLYNYTAGGGHWTSDWPLNIGSSASNSATITASDGGSGNIYFTDTNGCIAGISVVAYPPTGINYNDPSVYVDSTIHFNTYTVGGGAAYWSSSNTAVATIERRSGVATGISVGTTTITLSNGCIATTTLTVLLPSEIPMNSATQESEIRVFPNPPTTTLTISYKDKITSVLISNLLGQTLCRQQYKSRQVQVDVADLPAGMYLIRINNTEVRKFVKQ